MEGLVLPTISWNLYQVDSQQTVSIATYWLLNWTVNDVSERGNRSGTGQKWNERKRSMERNVPEWERSGEWELQKYTSALSSFFTTYAPLTWAACDAASVHFGPAVNRSAGLDMVVYLNELQCDADTQLFLRSFHHNKNLWQELM